MRALCVSRYPLLSARCVWQEIDGARDGGHMLAHEMGEKGRRSLHYET